jgi:hypothetical protein
MNLLSVTHFNNYSYIENERWRKNKETDGCVYGCPVRIKSSVPISSKIYVIEMNNETNSIMGIGLITNRILRKKSKIYSDENYNRYIYSGKKRINNNLIDKNTLKQLEERLFKGKNHLKRNQGIICVPKDITKKYLYYIKELFNIVFN